MGGRGVSMSASTHTGAAAHFYITCASRRLPEGIKTGAF